MAHNGARPGTDRPAFIVDRAGDYRVRHWFPVDIFFLVAMVLILVGIVATTVILINQAG